ncbi:MAG: glycosyltransferase [Deltaproteobacteria bacterium]|nr:glycosyltransferase [Deltaproteobacteria bacterium]
MTPRHVCLDVRPTGDAALDGQNALRLRTLVPDWQARGARVSVMAAPGAVLPAGATPLPGGPCGAWARQAAAIVELRGTLERLGADAFVGASGVVPLGWRGRSVLCVDGVPRHGSLLDRIATRAGFAASLRVADAVVVTSRALADDLERALGEPVQRVVVVPPVWPVPRAPRARLVRDGRAVLNAAGVIPGHHFAWTWDARGDRPQVVLAAVRVVSVDDDAQLLLLGPAPAWEALVRHAAPDLLEEGVAVLAGEPPADETEVLWAGAAGALFPVVTSSALLGALGPAALGTPVLASTTPAARDLLGQAATCINPTDVDAWAEEMTDLLGARRGRPPVFPPPVDAWWAVLTGERG